MVIPARLLIAAGILVMLILFTPLAPQDEILLHSELLLQRIGHQPAIAAAALYFTVFMALLLVRYLVLVLYSYLEHLYTLFEGKADSNGGVPAVQPLISVIVPVYNEGPVIAQALGALLELEYACYEIIVVDDGSTDDTRRQALDVAGRSGAVPVRVLTKANGGKASALNYGIAHARGDFIFCMDGDTRLSPNTLKDCVRHFADSRVGAVAGNVKVANRENALTCLQALEYIEGLALVRRAQSFFRAVAIIPGPAGMFRRDALLSVRAYDSDTFAEDCDTTLKLLLAGWQVRYEPSAIAWVETPSRLLNLIKQRYRWTRGLIQAVAKHRASLLRPLQRGSNCLLLWYMVFESIVWPVSNVAANLFFLYVGFEYGLAMFFLYWWLQLTLLDTVAAVYSTVIEEEDIRLAMLAPLFRIWYLLTLDVTKTLAACEELFNVHMTWGKLEREGKL